MRSVLFYLLSSGAHNFSCSSSNRTKIFSIFSLISLSELGFIFVHVNASVRMGGALGKEHGLWSGTWEMKKQLESWLIFFTCVFSFVQDSWTKVILGNIWQHGFRHYKLCPCSQTEYITTLFLIGTIVRKLRQFLKYKNF